MAVLITNINRYLALSSDTKPTIDSIPEGSLWEDLDTGDIYMWEGKTWQLKERFKKQNIISQTNLLQDILEEMQKANLFLQAICE